MYVIKNKDSSKYIDMFSWEETDNLQNARTFAFELFINKFLENGKYDKSLYEILEVEIKLCKSK